MTPINTYYILKLKLKLNKIIFLFFFTLGFINRFLLSNGLSIHPVQNLYQRQIAQELLSFSKILITNGLQYLIKLFF